MILYEPASLINFRDYGIMLPIPPDRGKHVLEFLGDVHPMFDFSKAEKLLGQIDFKFTREDLERVHSKEYVSRLFGDGLESALLNTFELIDAHGNPCRYEPEKAVKFLSHLFEKILIQASGTYLASRLALESGFCYYLGGGMHHARYDSGAGFCLINDIAITAFKVLAEKLARHIWIIDIDVHKGDGTAELVYYSFTGNAKEEKRVFTFSIHMANGWPLNRENIEGAEIDRAPLLPSDVDIGIEAGEESEYVARLAEGLRELEKISGKKPDFAIVVDGADVYEHDELSSSSLLRLTLEQCVERDAYVYRYLKERKIPSAWIQAGGYGNRAWEPHAHFLKKIKKSADFTD